MKAPKNEEFEINIHCDTSYRGRMFQLVLIYINQLDLCIILGFIDDLWKLVYLFVDMVKEETSVKFTGTNPIFKQFSEVFRVLQILRYFMGMP